jgi:hypothetical protein
MEPMEIDEDADDISEHRMEVEYFGRYKLSDMITCAVVSNFKALPYNVRLIARPLLGKVNFLTPLYNPKFNHLVLYGSGAGTQLMCYCPIQQDNTGKHQRWVFFGFYPQTKTFEWVKEIFNHLEILRNKIFKHEIYFEYVFDLNSDMIDVVLKTMTTLKYSFLISVLPFYDDNNQIQVIRFDPTKKADFTKKTVQFIHKMKFSGSKSRFLLNSEDLRKIYKKVDVSDRETFGSFYFGHRVRTGQLTEYTLILDPGVVWGQPRSVNPFVGGAKNRIYFHTHPAETCRKLHVKWGNPSSPDLVYLITNFEPSLPGSCYILVFAKEGLYFVSVNPKLVHVVEHNRNVVIRKLETTKDIYGLNPYSWINKMATRYMLPYFGHWVSLFQTSFIPRKSRGVIDFLESCVIKSKT